MGSSAQPPPAYGASNSETDVPPPSYYSKIGRKTIGDPLVTIPELKAHLRLLRGFSQLKSRVVDSELDLDLDVDMGDGVDRKWALFVSMAVERFDRFCASLNVGEVFTEECLPPLDVFMVWHAYLLNPLRYAEDTDIRVRAQLDLLNAAGSAIAPLERTSQTLTSPETSSRRAHWEKKTGLPFDPFACARVLKTRTVTCPKCTRDLSVPLVTRIGSGYLQQNFSFQCGCGFDVSKERLAVHKLVRDLTSAAQYLPGTLYNTTSGPDPTASNAFKNRILKWTKAFKRPKDPAATQNDWVQAIQEKHEYSLPRIHAAMQVSLKAAGARTVNRVVLSYASADDRLFSLDLVGAVLRQESFVEKMVGLRWTEPEFADDPDEAVLVHAIARYHAFLDLMASSPASFFVPTLDIDLAWHTHQLHSAKYASDTFTYVGRFIDHNDRVEEDKLSNAFDITCRAWEDRFGVRYTHCGCPVAGEKIGRRLSRIFSSSSSSSKERSELVPPGDRADLLGGTHPSDHNAVCATEGETDAARRRRLAKRAERAARDDEKIRKGELDGKWRERRAGHDPAFLMPMPLYYGYGCVAVGGHAVTVGGGGAACAGGGAGGCGGGCGGGACGGGGGCGGGSGCGGGGGGGGCGGGGGGGS